MSKQITVNLKTQYYNGCFIATKLHKLRKTVKSRTVIKLSYTRD